MKPNGESKVIAEPLRGGNGAVSLRGLIDFGYFIRRDLVVGQMHLIE